MYRRLAVAINEGTDCDPNFDHALRLYHLLDALERSDAQGGTRLSAPA
jgi:hypothetical protein